MIFELIIALLIGVIAGSITGLLPGIHINLVAVFLLSAAIFLPFPPIILAVFIVSMSITHTFIDFIPSIFLGAPDEDTSLSVLPGHQFLLQGKGYEAVIYTLYGSALGILLIFVFTPVFLLILPQIFSYLKYVMLLILLLASIYLLVKEKNSKFLAILIFLLSGFLGLVSLNLNQSLLPLLSGLFGSSSLITSIIKKQKVPMQKITSLKNIKLEKREFSNVLLASSFASPLCSFLPALGSSQAAVIGSDILEKTKQREFLMLLGSINTIVLGLSFVTLYAIEKTRTGSAVAISKLLPSLNLSNLSIILAAILISGIFAFFLAIFLAKIFAKNITKIRYNKLSIIVLAFLSLVVFIFSGFLGFLVFLVSTFTGLTAIYAGVRRTHLMGSMMVTSILFYLPF